MKNIFRVVTFILICISVVAGFKGIPDSEDKSYIYEKGDYKCLSHKTLPKGTTFTPTFPTQPQMFLYGEDTTKCPYLDLFNITRKFPKLHDIRIYIDAKLPHRYVFHEDCPNSGGSRWPYVWSLTINVPIDCTKEENDGFPNANYAITTALNGTCNFWLCLGRTEVIKQLHPPYPMYTLPTDKENYYFSTDPLPADLQATDDGIAIDIFKASQTTYTVHKMAKRPIQTIEIKTTKCSGLIVTMNFDGTCEIAVQQTTHQFFYYVNGEQRVIDYQPKEFVLVFTYSTAYLYTFDPLGIYPFTGCTFDSTHASNADYTLKVWYDKSQSVPSCKVTKLRFLEPAAIKRWKTTTTIAASAASTTASTEPVTTEVPTSTGSKIWIIVAAVCCAAVFVIVLAVLLTICFIKWRTRTKAPPKSTFDEHASAC